MSDAVANGGDAIAVQQMQDTCGRASLFRLPPELRLVIWKFLLPGRRVFRARSCGARLDPRRTDDRRFVFGFDTKVSQPILSQICAESRQCLLDHGQLVFGLGDEAGLWWGPQDVLLFTGDCCTGRPHFLEYFTALNELTIVFKPVTLLPTTAGFMWHDTAPVEWGTISQFLEMPWDYSWATFGRDCTNMDDAVLEVARLRRLWVSIRRVSDWFHFDFDDTFNEDRVLFNFCTDTPHTGLTYEPTRVTSFDMIRGRDWAL
ncbi:hypothetical protein KVR01_010772 [Diaporthe batatas]|uniref:uncharacterized protein n=1 Tax=Diaporthe batatas TaxID=748121 RepID=UPI001D043A0E|nr:uncharacterized protein KVR01_010772 [Diaporthe batatas]KAG8159111.1 hypothetical protein KVR01_010772 [Diaporthe batatas]